MMLDRERQEAIDAGERALDSLYGARRELASAGNWGLLDLFGGQGSINVNSWAPDSRRIAYVKYVLHHK